MPNTLLLADDSATIRRVIELTFQDEDVRIVAVSSGREAIARIEASAPDIILADAGLADVSGYDVAAFVKGRHDLRHVPVVLLAGAFEPLDEQRARRAGVDGVLVKPFEPQMVLARVRELLSPAWQYAEAASAAAAGGGRVEVPREALRSAGRNAERPFLREAPRPASHQPHRPSATDDQQFDRSLDRLDEAFAASQPTEVSLDSSSADEFASYLRGLRAEPGPAGNDAHADRDRGSVGGWDLAPTAHPPAPEPPPQAPAWEPEAWARDEREQVRRPRHDQTDAGDYSRQERAAAPSADPRPPQRLITPSGPPASAPRRPAAPEDQPWQPTSRQSYQQPPVQQRQEQPPAQRHEQPPAQQRYASTPAQPQPPQDVQPRYAEPPAAQRYQPPPAARREPPQERETARPDEGQPSATSRQARSEAPPLADAFSTLLAAEEGRPGRSLHGAVYASLPPNTQLTAEEMDMIVDRVIARLGSGVRGAVIDLAERLVRAEMDRLKTLR